MTSSLPPDPYKILGVSKDAQITEIRSAHRKLVLKCHPDKVQDPTLKAQKQDEFQKVQQAYELLSDETERQKYDDQVKLADLREQMKKANMSTPRSTKFTEYEIRTAEPRSSSYKSASGHAPPTMSKGYTYSRSWEDDMTHGPRIFENSRSTRREQTYTESKSKRESERERDKESRERDKEKERERERERERDRERERERERERRKKSEKEEAARRAEKDAKEARRAEKKLKEKQRDKDIKRESDEKKKHAKPYIEEYDDETPTPKSEKKKSSSKKYDEKRDRSSQREEATGMPIPTATRTFSEFATTTYVDAPRVTAEPSSWTTDMKLNSAASYIEASRAKEGGPKRNVIYHARQPPAAPTPPPAPGAGSPFAVPPMAQDDDDVRRSAARSRRGSTESARLREKYRKPSREPIQEDEPIILSASPSNRHSFQRSSTTTPAVSSSPPHLSRTNTMPAEASYSRSIPTMQRAQTFNSYGEGSDPRGRNRSRMHPQIDEESDSDDYEHRTRDRKHRSSRRTHSPDYVETSGRYPVYETRPTYSRRVDPESERERYSYHPSGYTESRPQMPPRETSYSTSVGSTHFGKVKTSKSYSYEDAEYSQYQQHKLREEHPVYA